MEKYEQSRDALDLLPFELSLQIAELSPATRLLLSCAIPSIGRYSLDPDVQYNLMNRFMNSKCLLPNGAKHGKHTELNYRGPHGVLPPYIDYVQLWYRNGELHRNRDQPAVMMYYTNGRLAQELWYQDGYLCRTGDLPIIKHHRREPRRFNQSNAATVLSVRNRTKNRSRKGR